MAQKSNVNGLGAVLRNNEKAKPSTALLETLKTALPQYFEKDVYDEEGNLIKEGSFKTDKFLAELKENNISEAHDGYKLGFVGKDYARLQVGRASETMIVPDCKHNSKEENAKSENIFITGDNLEALRHLVNAYERQIKLIYIDPPYNTGKEFTYSDTFEYNDEKLKNALGYSDEEISRLKSIQGKSSHSAWLAFMYPRLKLAQKLLKDDGVIFISIDDNEQANLKLLMDDILGEGNFVGTIVWKKKTNGNNMGYIPPVHDYFLVYKKLDLIEETFGFPITQEYIDKTYKNPDNDPRGDWTTSDLSANHVGPHFGITNPKTGEVHFPSKGRYWVFNEQEVLRRIKDGRIIFGKNGDNSPVQKKFLGERDIQKFKAESWWDKHGFNEDGTEILNKLFQIPKIFTHSKPVETIKHIINISTQNDDIILDFFAGSATTAHAVMQLNAEDCCNRKFIMVQLDEPTNPESDARKAGYDTIDEIARKRIELAAKKTKGEAGLLAGGLDLGFKHYRLITPDTKTLDKITEFNPQDKKLFNDDMISPFAYKKTETTGLDVLLTTWLIDDGLPFNTKVEELQFADYKAHYVAELATLYLISPDWDTRALKALLNSTGKNQLNVATIIVYPYSFSFEALRELQTNIHTNLEKSPAIIERY